MSLDIKVIEGKIYCNEIDINLTSSQVQDYVSQTGQDYMKLIEWQYSQCKDLIRDRKLDLILQTHDTVSYKLDS